MRKHGLLYVLLSLFIQSCATFTPQYLDVTKQDTFPSSKKISHTFYLIGDAGQSPEIGATETLTALQAELTKATKNSSVIFLGDNIYPNGLPAKDHPDYASAAHQLDVQTNVVDGFLGETMFIPGNHDWYSDGLKGLNMQQKYIEKKLKSSKVFYPEDGCPLTLKKINDDVVVIVIDTQWYLTNWDDHPTINDDCEIKTRSKFFDELEGLIKKNRDKTTLIVTHHPMFTDGSHGGQYSFAQQLFPLGQGVPLPVLGSLLNLVRKTGGVSLQDVQNKRYIELRKRIIALAQESDKVIIASGHEHSLQYIVKDNTPQIVSGSGAKASATRQGGGSKFSYGNNGFARLDIFNDGSSFVQFFAIMEGDLTAVFTSNVLGENKKEEKQLYTDTHPSTFKASVYSLAETTKSKGFKNLWGDRYRDYYSTEISVPTVNLDTLYGGLIPTQKGGGHQSKSLRLEDINGREYVMRAIRKSALKYLQAVAFKDQYIEGQFEDTFTQTLLLDVFTGSHPYAPFTISELSDAIQVYHTNPSLYYVPKQQALQGYNDDYGDELYMIEERATKGHGNQKSFGNSDELISTDDVLKKLRKDEKYQIDESSYIRARLFDMLIGDWDRHEDQWRWAEFKKKDKTIYRPVPRDRDQAFSIMSDGWLLGIATRIIPTLRLMQSYEEELRSPKWFNLEPYPLDMAIISESDKHIWDEQVRIIQDGLNDSIINAAFLKMPIEVQDETVETIKRKLKGRLANLQKISDSYYAHLNKFAVVTGTDKDDWVDVEITSSETIKVSLFRIIDGKKAKPYFERSYHKKLTKEIWIYSLDDKDHIKVFGANHSPIKIRLIGGQNKDTYELDNVKNVHVYDFKTKESILAGTGGKIHFTNDYEINVYDYKKLKNSANQLIPSLGVNPDDGLRLGLTNTYTVYGFDRNPFTQQHAVNAVYYFATEGFDIQYKGEIAKVVGNWNLQLNMLITSPNYSINFFGYGNASINPDEIFGLDYNRVKLRTFRLQPSLIHRGELGGSLKAGIVYENIEVEETTGRYIDAFIGGANERENSFYGLDLAYAFVNRDNAAFPTLGMKVGLDIGYRANLERTEENFAFVKPVIGFDYKLVSNGKLVLATLAKAHLTLGDDFQFYQAANLGSNDGLRGYRNYRFAGKNSFYQNTDLRFNLRKLKSGLLPLNVGIYTGFDYGKVWVENSSDDNWNTSFGGGIFVNGADMITANISYFNSDDGGRIAFKLGFGF